MKTFKQKMNAFTIGFCMSIMVFGSTTTYAVDQNPPGIFQLDGNPQTEFPKVGDDWEKLWNLGANDGGIPLSPSLVEFTGIITDPSPVSIFTQGGSKDINDISAWKFKDGTAPDKDDITNAFAAAYQVQDGQAAGPHNVGDLVIYFGLDRFDNNGDAFAGFWFFQNPVAAVYPDGESRTTARNFTIGGSGTHVAKADIGGGLYSPGDVLILVEFPQGANATPIIKGYEWDPDDVDMDGNKDEDGKSIGPLDLFLFDDAICDPTDGTFKLACAGTNPEGSPSVPAVWPYIPKGGVLGDDYPHETFYSGGINITQLLGQTPCFSSFLAETRSSASETAQLKDFVLGEFSICGITVDKTADTDQLCTDGNPVDVVYSYNICNDGFATVQVIAEDDQANPTGAPLDIVELSDSLFLDPHECSDNVLGAGGLDTTIAIAGSDTITNTVTVTAFDALTSVAVDQATDTWNIVTGTCSISVTKTADRSAVCEDASNVDYTIVVENTGSIDISNYVVNDPLLSFSDNNSDGILESGEIITYNPGNTSALNDVTVSELLGHSVDGDAGEDVRNTVTASGTAFSDNVSNTSYVDVTVHRCDISITKNCPATIDPDENMPFDGRITNTGTTAIEITSLVDNNEENSSQPVATNGNVVSLAAGAFVHYDGSYFPIQQSGTHEDTITVIANAFDGQNQELEVTSSDTAGDDPTCVIATNPEIEVTKSCTPTTVIGANISFEGVATNNGDVDLESVSITDTYLNADGETYTTVAVAVADFDGALAKAGGSIAYNSSYTPHFTWNKNVITATGTDVVNTGLVTAQATAICSACPFVDNPASSGDTAASPGVFATYPIEE